MRRVLIAHLWTDAERHFVFHASFLCSFLCHSFHNKNVGEPASGGGQNWNSDLRTEKFTRVMKWTNLNCTLFLLLLLFFQEGWVQNTSLVNNFVVKTVRRSYSEDICSL